jgi:hypothetical protein
MHSALCEKARDCALKVMDPIFLSSEKSNGLESIFKATCRGCDKEFIFNKGDNLSCKGVEVSDINVKGVWGSMVTGGGCSDLNELLGTMGIPGLKPNQYTKIEEQVGEW